MGIIFWYWPHYKELDSLEVDDEENENDHGGERIRDLYVKRKWNSFKEEALEYQYLTPSQWKMVVTKAESNAKTQNARQLRAHTDFGQSENYGIPQNDSIGLEHLESLGMDSLSPSVSE